MNETMQKRMVLAREIVNHISKDKYLLDDIHAEMDQLSMPEIVSPKITQNMDQVVENHLADQNHLAIHEDDLEGLKGYVDTLLEGSTGYDATGSIFECLYDIRQEQCPDDQDPDERAFSLSPDELLKITSDISTKLEMLISKIDNLENA